MKRSAFSRGSVGATSRSRFCRKRELAPTDVAQYRRESLVSIICRSDLLVAMFSQAGACSYKNKKMEMDRKRRGGLYARPVWLPRCRLPINQ